MIVFPLLKILSRAAEISEQNLGFHQKEKANRPGEAYMAAANHLVVMMGDGERITMGITLPSGSGSKWEAPANGEMKDCLLKGLFTMWTALR